MTIFVQQLISAVQNILGSGGFWPSGYAPGNSDWGHMALILFTIVKQ